ncbi:MAG: methyltransferase [Cyclobacteriaceae bacterium]
MKALLQFLTAPIRLFIKWYLRKPRSFSYNGIKIIVLPGVFHPGFFHSTKIVLDYLSGMSLEGQSFLELGSGTGIISVSAALKNANVTAVDISHVAVQNTILNRTDNKVNFTVLHSDLFENLNPTRFDWIVINPPYYPANPQTEAEYAWYCGDNHQYFRKLFSQLLKFTHEETKVLIVLSEVCDLKEIFSFAQNNNLVLEKIYEKKVWVDGFNYLFLAKSIT